MALTDTGKAIGSVTRLLQAQLYEKVKNNGVYEITSKRPGKQSDKKHTILNIFLYEIQYDANLKNTPLDEGQKPPLWLVLKYLLTAYSEGESDSDTAYDYLGLGMQALQELSFLPLNSSTVRNLGDNPGVLKITFDEIPPDLLSKLMQGGDDEKYRLSVGFQVRPVMIAPDLPSSYSYLVGVDNTKTPAEVIAEKGINIPIIPSMGPSITRISPLKFEPSCVIKKIKSILTIYGKNLAISGLSIGLGNAELPVIAQQSDKLICEVYENIGSEIPAGSLPISVIQTLPGGRRRSSNLLIGNLMPILEKADFTSPLPLPSQSGIFGYVDLTGALLGRKEGDRFIDDIFIAFYKDGKIIRIFNPPPLSPGPAPLLPPLGPPQTQLRLEIKKDLAVPAIPKGTYRIILRVNGQQAKNSPEVTIP